MESVGDKCVSALTYRQWLIGQLVAGKATDIVPSQSQEAWGRSVLQKADILIACLNQEPPAPRPPPTPRPTNE